MSSLTNKLTNLFLELIKFKTKCAAVKAKDNTLKLNKVLSKVAALKKTI